MWVDCRCEVLYLIGLYLGGKLDADQGLVGRNWRDASIYRPW